MCKYLTWTHYYDKWCKTCSCSAFFILWRTAIMWFLQSASQTWGLQVKLQVPLSRTRAWDSWGSAGPLRLGSIQVAGDQSQTDTRCGERAGWSQDVRHEAWLHFLLPSLWRRQDVFLFSAFRQWRVNFMLIQNTLSNPSSVHDHFKMVYNQSRTQLSVHKATKTGRLYLISTKLFVSLSTFPSFFHPSFHTLPLFLLFGLFQVTEVLVGDVLSPPLVHLLCRQTLIILNGCKENGSLKIRHTSFFFILITHPLGRRCLVFNCVMI